MGLIKEFFGSKSGEFIIIVFTGADELKDETIESYIQTDRDGFVQQMIEDCGGRYQIFNNNGQNRAQVTELLSKVELVVKRNSNSCYTSEFFQEAKALIQKEMDRILKEKEEEMLKENEINNENKMR